MFDAITVAEPSYMIDELQLFREAVDWSVKREVAPHIDVRR